MMKILLLLCLGLHHIMAQGNSSPDHHYLDVETPNFFNYNSPLKQPDSLRSQPYFDFLSTLYRRDTGKSGLFQPYLPQNRRERRSTPAIPVIPSLELQAPPIQPEVTLNRAKRAVIFRPLFVYRQQQLQRQSRRLN